MALNWWDSPYINHFISADTIIPDQYNPQNLNRYSSVLNNPLRYTDPTGHMVACEDGDICWSPNTGSSFTGGNGKHRGHRPEDDPDPNPNGSSCDTNGNGVADIPCAGLRTRDWNDFARGSTRKLCPVTSLVECYYAHMSLNMSQVPMNISLEEFQALLLAIYYEMDGRNSADLIISSISTDTPFYDLGVFGFGAQPGTACINGLGCYARHELNYMAQGEASAAAGEPMELGLSRVYAWKGIFGPLKYPSPGTITMWTIGYVYYHAQNGSSAPPYIPYVPNFP